MYGLLSLNWANYCMVALHNGIPNKVFKVLFSTKTITKSPILITFFGSSRATSLSIIILQSVPLIACLVIIYVYSDDRSDIDYCCSTTNLLVSVLPFN